MTSQLQGKKIAILATDGFEQVELSGPRKALNEAGAETVVISPKSGQIKGWNKQEWGDAVQVDRTLDQASAGDFDAPVLPGGVMNPGHLRMEPKAVEIVRAFYHAGKSVAAHGPWTLVEADALRGRTVTSWPSLKTNIRNAGGNWVDQEVVRDGQFVFSRKPDDTPAFSRAVIELVGTGAVQKAAA